MRAGVFSGDAARRPASELLEAVRSAPTMAGSELASQVSTSQAYVVPAEGERRFTVAAIDLGIKGATPRHMVARGLRVHLLPASTTFAELSALRYSGSLPIMDWMT